jgi:hypothetical protein
MPADTHPFAEVEGAPHDGHARSVHHVRYPGAVRIDFDPIEYHTGKPTTASCRSFTPVARHIGCLDNSHDHDGLRAADVRVTTPQSDRSASPMERAETTLAR